MTRLSWGRQPASAGTCREGAGREHARERDKRQGPPIELQLVDARRCRQKRGHERHQPGGQAGAERAANRGDEQPLANHRAGGAVARRAEGGADRQLARAPMNLDEGQPGDVGDRDEPAATRPRRRRASAPRRELAMRDSLNNRTSADHPASVQGTPSRAPAGSWRPAVGAWTTLTPGRQPSDATHEVERRGRP